MSHPWPTFSPEANYTALASGSGPASTLAYGETLSAEAANLQTVTAASAATGAATYGASWQGMGATASATTQTAMDAQHQLLVAALLEKVPHVAAAASAHQTALASMVTAEQAVANRMEEATAQHINPTVLGALTPRIAALNLEYYGQMWPRNAGAGAAYSAALRASTAALMVPFPPAVAGASAAAPAVAAAALAENAAIAGAGATMQASEQAVQAAITPAAAAAQAAAPLAATQTAAQPVALSPQPPVGMFAQPSHAGGLPAQAVATPGGQGLASPQVQQALTARAETLSPPTGSAPGPAGVASGYPGAGLTSYVRPKGDGFSPPTPEQASGASPGMLNAAALTTASVAPAAVQPLAYVHPEPPRPTVASTPAQRPQLDLGDTAHTKNIPPPPPQPPPPPAPQPPPGPPAQGFTGPAVPATPLNDMHDPTGTGEGGDGGLGEFAGGPPGGAFGGGIGGLGPGGNLGRGGGGGSTTGGGTRGGGRTGGNQTPPESGPKLPPTAAEPPFPPPGRINGRTSHGEDSIESRDGHGVNDHALQDAVEHPVSPPRFKLDEQGRGSYVYDGKDATVVLNQDGQVVTCWATNHNGWRH